MYMSMCVHVQPDVFYMDKLSIHVRLGSAQSFKQHNLKVKTVDKFFIFTVPIPYLSVSVPKLIILLLGKYVPVSEK